MQPWLIIVLLGLSIIVYARLFFQSENGPSQDKLIAEMENTFEHFALEIEEENKQLLEHILSLKQQNDGQNSKLISRIEFLEQQFIEKTTVISMKENILEASQIPVIPASKVEVVQEPEITKPKKFKMEIKQRYKELFELHDQGKSMEYISKKLEMNKGEVQLILQLAEQEELSSV